MMATAFLGKTKFEISETSSPDTLRITRNNERVTELFIPKELIVEYVTEVVMARAPEIVRQLLLRMMK